MAFESGSIARLQFAAGLHDIGKVNLPDSILQKSGPLDATEWDAMREHPKLGFDILCQSDDSCVRTAALVALCHHERWDGSGYPCGLAGEEIPPEARIVGLCDVYHALRETRPYKSSLNHEQALAIILNGDGSGRTRPSHFDPITYAAFRTHSDLMRDAIEEPSAVGSNSQRYRQAGHF
jgi:putative two-component system response regulator